MIIYELLDGRFENVGDNRVDAAADGSKSPNSRSLAPTTSALTLALGVGNVRLIISTIPMMMSFRRSARRCIKPGARGASPKSWLDGT